MAPTAVNPTTTRVRNSEVEVRVDDRQEALDMQLLNAAGEGDAVGVRAALAAGADACTTRFRFPPILNAARGGSLDAVRALVDAGARADVTGQSYGPGSTPLQAAAAEGHVDIVRFFLALGLDVDLASADGATALWWAAWGSHPDVIAVLLAAGANPNAIDRRGNSAIDWVISDKSIDYPRTIKCARALLDAGAIVTSETVHCAMRKLRRAATEPELSDYGIATLKVLADGGVHIDYADVRDAAPGSAAAGTVLRATAWAKHRALVALRDALMAGDSSVAEPASNAGTRQP